MSEASAHKLSLIAEATRGTTPATPRFRRLPDTRTTLALSKETLASERLTGNRFPAEPRTGASTVAGDIPVDLSYGTYDDLIASALQGAWVDGTAGEDTADFTNDTFDAGAAVGDTYDTTNGVVTIERIDAKAEEVDLFYTASGAKTNFAITKDQTSVVIDGDTFEVEDFTDVENTATVKAGDDRKSFSVLREFSDMTGDKFLLLSGLEVATWSLTASANAIAKSTFTFFGRKQEGPNATAPTGTSYAPALDTEPFDTFSGSLKIDGVSKCIVTDYSLTVNNGHTARYAVGCAESDDPSVAQSVIEGSITAYFEDMTLYKKFIDEEKMSLELTLADSNGNKLVVKLPNLRLTSGTQPDVSGDGPITIPINFTAHKDDALDSHISVTSVSPVAA